MKKIFLDMYLHHNLGDDLFLYTILTRYPNCEFVINYKYRGGYKLFF